MMIYPSTSPFITLQRTGVLGQILLHKTATLNAVDKAMTAAIDAGLTLLVADPAVKVIAITSALEKAFCVGGDVKSVVLDAREDAGRAAEFFRAEYILNARLAALPKPLVSIIDGLCMGGGLGLAIHAPYCAVTPKASLAMPEMMIGLFPDVGAGAFLNRYSPAVGRYLALTGARVMGADAVHLKLANALIDDPAALLTDLSHEGIAIWDKHCKTVLPVPQLPLAAIEQCFTAGDIPTIKQALQQDASLWALEALSALVKGSPLSQCLALRHLKESIGQDLPSILRREFRLAYACTHGHDFLEGVRALLLDKDKAPRWQFAGVEDVPASVIDAYFAPQNCCDLEIN